MGFESEAAARSLGDSKWSLRPGDKGQRSRPGLEPEKSLSTTSTRPPSVYDQSDIDAMRKEASSRIKVTDTSVHYLQQGIKVNRDFYEFLKTLLHEFNNPLTASITYGDLLARTGNMSPKQEKYLEEMRKGTKRLGLLAAELGDFLKHGAELPIWESAELNKSVTEIYRDFKGQMALKKIKSRAKTSIKEDLSFITDKRKFNRMLSNILQNAIDAVSKLPMEYREEFQDQISIKTTFSEDQKFALITIKNLGEISKDQASKLFDFNKRAISTSDGGDSIGQSSILSSVAAIKGAVQLLSRGSIAKRKPVIVEVKIPLLDSKPVDPKKS